VHLYVILYYLIYIVVLILIIGLFPSLCDRLKIFSSIGGGGAARPARGREMGF
jgi:hypothetical protein